MEDYKYKKITSKNYHSGTFEQFLSHQYNMSFQRAPRTIIQIADENGKGVQYYPDNLYYGREYFVGAQRFEDDCYGEWGDDTVKRYAVPCGVYKFVGITTKRILNTEFETGIDLVFEDKNKKQYHFLPGTTVLTKKRLLKFQAAEGFWFPPLIKEQWPDVVEQRDNIKTKDPYKECPDDGIKLSPVRFIFDRVALMVGIFSLFAFLFVIIVAATDWDTIGGSIVGFIFAVPVVFFGWFVLSLFGMAVQNDFKKVFKGGKQNDK